MLQSFPAKFQRLVERDDIEKSSGEKIIKLKRINTLWRTLVTVGCQWTSVAHFSGWTSSMASRNSDLSSRFM
ncbi:hypothetical protein ESCAB7627_2753 [Escherichia albertii TW07627]|uniref:Uncharacterized protein n=1 Tax=Escherichia albertii (strain TW07627) TaxID=502347 RepID=A0ABC9NMA0_ESCAT|nr:hypothetical protein ESCAB7627_2753 [Escherichia albertii TW07627]